METLLRGVRSYICLFENKGAARPSYSASALGTGQQSSTCIATDGLQVAPAVRNVDIIEDIYEYTIGTKFVDAMTGCLHHMKMEHLAKPHSD